MFVHCGSGQEFDEALLAHVSSLAIRLFDSGLRLYLLQVSQQTSLRLPNRSDERAQ